LINTSTFIFLFLLSIYNVVLSRSNGKFVIGFSLY
jgi:multisubunit Na+/H+ antiporter MnhC subunit